VSAPIFAVTAPSRSTFIPHTGSVALWRLASQKNAPKIRSPSAFRTSF